MRYFLAIFAVTIVAVVGVLGFRGTHSRRTPLYIFPDMEVQAKLRPQKDNKFFANERSSQVPVAGTVARAVPYPTVDGDVMPYENKAVNTGFVPGSTNFVEHNQMPITTDSIRRGQERYRINCTPCHGALGDGNGITRKIGAMAVVANLHDKRIVEMTDGELFYVITHGRNLMGPYASTITIPDRWAIISYVRALQLAQLGSVDDLPLQMRGNFQK